MTGAPRRRRARDRQPHGRPGRSGSRRGSPIRSTACTWCSSRAGAGRRRRSTRRARHTRSVVGPADEQTADVLAAAAQGRHLKLAPDAARAAWPRTSATTRAVCPSSSSSCTRPTATTRRSIVDEVEPYLGELGTAGRFDLTNAIDRGDVAAALEVLHRLLTATSARAAEAAASDAGDGDRSCYHYQRLLRLDDPSSSPRRNRPPRRSG